MPSYRYVPGLNPHPLRHPGGHSLQKPAEEAPIERYWLRGLDLFDHRYYWEAHEAWEEAWRRVPRSEPFSWLLQGLIQAAAAALKRHLGAQRAAERLHGAAIQRIEAALSAEGPRFKGLDLPATIAALNAAAADPGGYSSLICSAR